MSCTSILKLSTKKTFPQSHGMVEACGSVRVCTKPAGQWGAWSPPGHGEKVDTVTRHRLPAHKYLSIQVHSRAAGLPTLYPCLQVPPQVRYQISHVQETGRRTFWSDVKAHILTFCPNLRFKIFNRPGVAGAVLHTASSLIN